MAGDWSNLPSHLLELVACRLPFEGLIDFGQTCSSWHNVVVQLRGRLRPRISVPWLLITDRTRPESCRFFSPRDPCFYEFPLPQVRDKRCLSSQGWIMAIGRDGEVEIFNPLSRARACAKLSAMKQNSPIDYIGKFALSACPLSSVNSEIVVLCDANRQLALWNYQDQAWTMVDPCRIYMDLIYHKGRFLAVDAGGTIRAFEVKRDGPNSAAEGRVVGRTPCGLVNLKYLKKHYLVECSGSLLVVSQEWRKELLISSFRVVLLDLETSTWTKVESLGNTSLFLGLNSSFSMEVSDYRIEPNCIYFTDDRTYKHTEGNIKGIYHMADGRIEPLFDGPPVCPGITPLWIEPNANDEDYLALTS